MSLVTQLTTAAAVAGTSLLAGVSDVPEGLGDASFVGVPASFVPGLVAVVPGVSVFAGVAVATAVAVGCSVETT